MGRLCLGVQGRTARQMVGVFQTQQNAWIGAADSVMSTRKGGTQGALTGAQLYTKINSINVHCGNAVVTAPPAKPNVGAAVVTGLEVTNTNNVIAIKLTGVTMPPSGNPYIVRACKPQSFGVNATPQMAVIGVCPAATLGVADITALFSAKFGPPPVGSKIWVSVSATQSGWEDLPSLFMAKVPAGT